MNLHCVDQGENGYNDHKDARVDRRGILRLCALTLAASAGGLKNLPRGAELPSRRLTIKPYTWEGPYSEMRNNGAKHDWRLCAEVRAPWMTQGERLIVRSSEVVGYETGFLYDDHFPPSEPEGRGKHYHHIPFRWKEPRDNRSLSANCLVPNKGEFSLAMSAREDYLDIVLSLRNDLSTAMGEIDWAFCVVGIESASFSDSARTRTYLFDGHGLRTFDELRRDPKMELFNVTPGHGFVPAGHKMLSVSPVEAKASVVMVESPDRRHVAALGFERAYAIYGDAIGNKCFHADPYFGPLRKPGEKRTVKGRLYLMDGTAESAFARFQRDFPVTA